jgi:Family of unknown function (DUF5681)
MNARKTKSTPYEVGHCKPPRHTQFRKGRSGNPRGRPPRDPMLRVKTLTLREAYRGVVIKKNGRNEPATAIEAILRSQAELAVKGNVQAQRAILSAVRRFEKEDEEAAKLAKIRRKIYGPECDDDADEPKPDDEEGDEEEWEPEEWDEEDQELPVSRGTGSSSDPVDEQ